MPIDARTTYVNQAHFLRITLQKVVVSMDHTYY